ncbi:hypothetical protein [Bacteroides intestinalis]|jgi:hypothetical protein|uniref:hypothetical protein n=1 Tax=Bacteroides intestinalis TaxID=329854 RepID=UPI00164A6BDF|nr:hypothetical protein [Bacteroides intestinalis]
MKFIVDYNDYCGLKCVIYRKDEYSLGTTPWVNGIDFDIALNSLTLTVIDSIVVQLSGFCALSNAQRMTDVPPINKKGLLKVVDSESYIGGTGSFRIHNMDMPIYLNSQTGWLCIGYPRKVGIAVEFIDDCIFVIGKKQEFVSLWIHPTFI